MKENKINFILIQLDEAHSTAWPMGLPNPSTPQTSLKDRISRAKEFISKENCPFEVLVDTWDNSFANEYKAWPDKYYCVDQNLKIIAKSQYGASKEAIINKDCCDLIEELCNK